MDLLGGAIFFGTQDDRGREDGSSDDQSRWRSFGLVAMGGWSMTHFELGRIEGTPFGSFLTYPGRHPM